MAGVASPQEVEEGVAEEEAFLQEEGEEVAVAEEVVAEAEGAEEAEVVAWGEERKLSLSLTDIKVCSLPGARRMPW